MEEESYRTIGDSTKKNRLRLGKNVCVADEIYKFCEQDHYEGHHDRFIETALR